MLISTEGYSCFVVVKNLSDWMINTGDTVVFPDVGTIELSDKQDFKWFYAFSAIADEGIQIGMHGRVRLKAASFK